MAGRTFRDVLGEPSTWSHSATSTRRRPDMRDATVQNIFCSGSKVSVATRSIQYGDTLSVFNIPERDLRERVLRALRPGASVAKVLETPI
jgi:hypothetical protein